MRLCLALKDRGTETIFSPDPDSLSECFKDMDTNREELCRMLEKYDRERAEELRGIFKADVFSLREIWPSLKKVVCWNALDDSIIREYKPWLKDVDYNRGYYADELALYGEICGEHGEIRLEPDYVFYEFADISENLGKSGRSGSEVLVGEEYKLLLSNLSGLYRYDTEKLVKCIYKDKEKIVVRFKA